jgi:hypothetical protein
MLLIRELQSLVVVCLEQVFANRFLIVPNLQVALVSKSYLVIPSLSNLDKSITDMIQHIANMNGFSFRDYKDDVETS